MAWLNAEEEARYRAWMASAQGGDSAAFERLLTALLSSLRSFVRSRLRDDAAIEDVVQNVLFSVYKARHTYRPERPLGPWLRAIARNAVMDAHRDRTRRARREVPLQDAGPVAAPEPRRPDAALSSAMVEALSALPDGQREAVELLHVKGLSVAEAARKVGISPGALKVRAHRGYRALRVLLATSELSPRAARKS